MTGTCAVTEKLQFPLPLQGPACGEPVEPDHPSKTESAAGVAVKTIAVPPAYSSEQSNPHCMPAGLLETMPDPSPCIETLILKRACEKLLDVEVGEGELV